VADLETQVVVVGGGATGAAVLRDLALRGIDAVLVERADLGTGTSGRWHGLLHSGGRYAVKDPVSATECIEENRVLRRIAPHCIEDTGGLFVLLPENDQGYGDAFVEGCRKTGVPCEELALDQARKREPLLAPNLSRVFAVPDGTLTFGEDASRVRARHGPRVMASLRNLAVTLLDRSQRPVALTHAGEVFANYASDILARVTTARSAVGALRGLVEGDIALLTHALHRRRFVPALPKEFAQRYPCVKVELIERSWPEIDDGPTPGSSRRRRGRRTGAPGAGRLGRLARGRAAQASLRARAMSVSATSNAASGRTTNTAMAAWAPCPERSRARLRGDGGVRAYLGVRWGVPRSVGLVPLCRAAGRLPVGAEGCCYHRNW